MNILITGGAGFIGSSLTNELIKEHNIIVIDNFDNFYNLNIKKNNIKNFIGTPNYKLYNSDICNTLTLKNIFRENSIDITVHLAAKAGVRDSIINPKAFIESNINGTYNILEAMKDFQVPKLIFASSSSVYGNSEMDMFSEDDTACRPESPYAASKLAGEQLIYTFSSLYKIQAVCLRFFSVYGPRQRPDLAISKFVHGILNNKKILIYGNGLATRDFTYINDLVQGIIQAIFYKNSLYEIINLGSGRPISLLSLINIIEECLATKAQLVYHNEQLGDVKKTIANIAKAKKLLNFMPVTDIRDGVQQFINSII